MKNTSNYLLPQFEHNDVFNKEDINKAFLDIDTGINALQSTVNDVSAGGASTILEVANARSTFDTLDDRLVATDDIIDTLNNMLYGFSKNIKSYGAIGDGTSHPLSEKFSTLTEAQVKYPCATNLTDEIDWCAIQQCVIDNSTTFLASGNFIINKSILITSNKKITGDNWTTTVITMNANNTPIMTTNNYCENVILSSFKIRYANQQNQTDHPQSIAIALNVPADKNPGWGIYHWYVEKVWFVNSVVGIGQNVGTGYVAIWGNKLQDLYFQFTDKTAIDFASQTHFGQPTNEIRNIKILNQAIGVSAPYSLNTSYAIKTRGECLMENIDIEDWCNYLIYTDDCINLKISGLHAERITVDKTQSTLCILYGESFKIENSNVNLIVNNNDVNYFVSGYGVDTNMLYENITFTKHGSSTGTAKIILVVNTMPGKISCSNINGLDYYYPSWDDITLAGFVSIDGELIKRTAPPTRTGASSGNWNIGQRFLNSTPTAGSYTGWICVTGGTTSVWKGYGLIEA